MIMMVIRGLYPIIKDTYLYESELQEGVYLPIDPEIVDLNLINDENDNKEQTDKNNISIQMKANLPEVIVYPISVSEINIDFSSISSNTSFTYYINGAETETIDISEKTYTFEYNFADQLEIVVTNGIDVKTITINIFFLLFFKKIEIFFILFFLRPLSSFNYFT